MAGLLIRRTARSLAMLPRRRLRDEASKINAHDSQAVDSNLHTNKGFTAWEIYGHFINRALLLVPWFTTLSTPIFVVLFGTTLYKHIYLGKEIEVFEDRE
eukprot:TRINITY_DN17879_c0_g1_i1.p2 TRINITY_DN17879_c0_g1~~TRINITY_DN17879_c0_g1_i1.p2  ORF type:complete len:100 (+),score=16.87 TRINITY_DN17879_c0_g1_i1:128-427(+)